MAKLITGEMSDSIAINGDEMDPILAMADKKLKAVVLKKN
jgi:hypothetical protein